MWSFLTDKCFYGSDTLPRPTANLTVCFNDTGVIIATPNTTVGHGRLAGWSQEEQNFGFTRGDACPINSTTVTYMPRATKLFINCDINELLYSITYSKPRGPIIASHRTHICGCTYPCKPCVAMGHCRPPFDMQNPTTAW